MTRWIKVALAAMALLSAAGCSNKSRTMAEDIREGQKQYSRGNYLGAERVLSGAISVDPQNPTVAEAYYVRGLARLKLLKHQTAGQDFQRALRLSDRPDLRANAHVCLGSIAFESSDWDTAYTEYKQAEYNLSELSPSDWILFRLACSAQRSGRWDEGRKLYARILREFPESETAKAARRNMNYGFFQVQAGAFGSAQGAFARVEELRRAGIAAKVYAINTDGRGLKGVFVGRYNDYYQATKGLAKVGKVVPEARIVP